MNAAGVPGAGTDVELGVYDVTRHRVAPLGALVYNATGNNRAAVPPLSAVVGPFPKLTWSPLTRALPPLTRFVAAAALLGGIACVDVPQGLTPPKVSVVKVASGDAQVAQVGTQVPVSPSVLVLGVDSQPIVGLEVRFAVRTGHGSVTSPSKLTDSTGVATAEGWTVGDTPGTDTLIATVVGVKRLYVSATVTPPCGGGVPLVLGDSALGAIVDAGCVVTGGGRATPYTVHPLTNVGSVVTITAPTYHARMTMQSGGVPIATSVVAGDTAAASTMITYLAAGTYTLLAQGVAAADRGAFTLTSSVAAIYSGCLSKAFIVRGASTFQSIGTDGCHYLDGSGNGYYGHDYKIRLAAGSTLVATASATSIAPYILILNESGSQILLSADQIQTAHSASVLFVAPYSGFFIIGVISGGAPLTVGSYTLSVSPPPP